MEYLLKNNTQQADCKKPRFMIEPGLSLWNCLILEIDFRKFCFVINTLLLWKVLFILYEG